MYTLTKGIGTYLWMAPEVVNQQDYSFAADVYSFGMVRDHDRINNSVCSFHFHPYKKNHVTGALGTLHPQTSST
jgi:serine/threonine protein kinase